MIDENNMNLRHTFVGMLFALAIAQAAILFGDLFKVFTSGWDYHMTIQGLVDRLKTESYLLAAPASHLFLGVILVSHSWVGWSKSKSGGKSRDIDDIFSASFFLLIIEVFLVVLYFILISSVELSIDDFLINDNLNTAIATPSAAPEATLLFMIFLVYAMWDLVSDVKLAPISSEYTPLKSIPCFSIVVTLTTGIITYCGVSLLCAYLAWVIQKQAIISSTSISAVYGDLALIFLLYFFRSAKWLERIMIRIFPWEQKRTGARNATENIYYSLLKLIAPLVILLFFTYKM